MIGIMLYSVEQDYNSVSYRNKTNLTNNKQINN